MLKYACVVLTLVASVTAHAATIPAPGEFEVVGTASNSSSPSVWEAKEIDVTSSIPGAASAILRFGLRNDAPGTGSNVPNTPTNAEIRLAVDSPFYFVNVEWVSGNSTSKFRDVLLDIDGTVFRDQYGDFNNHLGDEFRGTVQDGSGEGRNLLGETGFAARTFVLRVPEPSAAGLLLAGSIVAVLGRRLAYVGRRCQ